jgi:D-sedoheptulose 7-phosphate isomerase
MVEMVSTIKKYFAEVEDMLEAISSSQLQQVLFILEQAYRDNRRVFVMGNGGSAATASHFALDLGKNTISGKCRRLRVLSLTDNVPLITAWSNDCAYEHIFSEQLANLVEAGDVVIGISASGNSLNVINACRLAKQERATAIGLLGADGGRMKEIVDAYILAPGQNIEQEEDAHMIISHVITRHMRNYIRHFPGPLVVSIPTTPANGFYVCEKEFQV